MEGSLFGRLSAEIRNQIYDLVLTAASESAGTLVLDSLNRTSNRIYTASHPLLHTSSQIRAEVAPMFYARNSFNITIRHRQFHALRTWLDLVGPEYVRLIKGLEVVVMERDFLMLLAVREVVQVLGMRGVRFSVREVNLGFEKQPGRREKGHGRFKKKGWKG